MIEALGSSSLSTQTEPRQTYSRRPGSRSSMRGSDTGTFTLSESTGLSVSPEGEEDQGVRVAGEPSFVVTATEWLQTTHASGEDVSAGQRLRAAARRFKSRGGTTPTTPMNGTRGTSRWDQRSRRNSTPKSTASTPQRTPSREAVTTSTEEGENNQGTKTLSIAQPQQRSSLPNVERQGSDVSLGRVVAPASPLQDPSGSIAVPPLDLKDTHASSYSAVMKR